MINKNYSSDQIKHKRRQVRDLLCQTSNNIKSGEIQVISNSDLKILFLIYDEIFFEGYFQISYKGSMIFSISRQLTRSAGVTKFPKNMNTLNPEQYQFEIKMSADFIFNYNKIDRDKYVNGIKTQDQLDALMLVFEHELCHVIEFLYFSKTSCKGNRFKQLAKSLFGHTDAYHGLPTINEINYKKYGFKLGEIVAFEFEGKLINGTIKRINKRATIISENKNGIYLDEHGKHYEKYLVPLYMLKKQTSIMD